VDVLLSLADSPLTELLTPFPDVLTDGTLDVRDMITLSDNSADAQVPFTLGAALTCCVYECLTVLLATRVQTCFSAFWVDASCFRWGAGGGLAGDVAHWKLPRRYRWRRRWRMPWRGRRKRWRPRCWATVSFLGDAKSSLGDAKSSLGDAKSSLGDAESSLGDAESLLGRPVSEAVAEMAQTVTLVTDQATEVLVQAAPPMLWARYLSQLATHPIRTKCITAFYLYSFSDTITQMLLEKLEVRTPEVTRRCAVQGFVCLLRIGRFGFGHGAPAATYASV
jgi:hypothetical protein